MRAVSGFEPRASRAGLELLGWIAAWLVQTVALRDSSRDRSQPSKGASGISFTNRSNSREHWGSTVAGSIDLPTRRITSNQCKWPRIAAALVTGFQITTDGHRRAAEFGPCSPRDVCLIRSRCESNEHSHEAPPGFRPGD